MSKCPTPEQIDALLPQTQCGLCGYGGCMPYANAIANESAAINLCPPGGIDTLVQLAELTHQSAEPYLDDMTNKAKPTSIVNIREQECIGCTKCIQACPVDAIIGAAKQMHTVLTDYCTGCDLCIPVCPVDCIDVITVTEPRPDMKQQRAAISRERYINRNKRLTTNKPRDDELKFTEELQQSKLSRQEAIKAALLRVQQKKVSDN